LLTGGSLRHHPVVPISDQVENTQKREFDRHTTPWSRGNIRFHPVLRPAETQQLRLSRHQIVKEHVSPQGHCEQFSLEQRPVILSFHRNLSTGARTYFSRFSATSTFLVCMKHLATKRSPRISPPN